MNIFNGSKINSCVHVHLTEGSGGSYVAPATCEVNIMIHEALGYTKTVFYTKVENGLVSEAEYESDTSEMLKIPNVLEGSVLWIQTDPCGIEGQVQPTVSENAMVLGHKTKSGQLFMAVLINGDCTIDVPQDYTYDETNIDVNGEHPISGFDIAIVNVPQPEACTVEIRITDAVGKDYAICYVSVSDGEASLKTIVGQMPGSVIMTDVMIGSVLWMEANNGVRDYDLIIGTDDNAEVLESKNDGAGNLKLTALIKGDCYIYEDGSTENIMDIKADGHYYVNGYNAVHVANADLASLVNYYNEDTFDLKLPLSIKSLPYYAFNGHSTMTSVDLGNVQKIGNFAFYGCKGLTELHIPATVESILHSAFNNCTGLTEVTFEGKPSSIASTAFSNCTNLAEIHCPWNKGEVANAPWGLTEVTINYSDITVDYPE